MQLTRRDRGDGGAVAILVALVLAPVLLSMSALVVDVGALYADRRQQQASADASSLAVAHDCALFQTTCTGKRDTPAVVAQDYASGGHGVPGSSYSSGKRSSFVEYVCGTGPGLAPCTSAQLAQCAGTVPTFRYVQTRTRTADGSGAETVLPSRFARALAGNAGDDGHETRGCARAAYGPVKQAPALAVTISYCEWNAFTGGGVSFVAPPPYDSKPSPSVEQILLLHGKGSACGGGPSGWDLPGGFGWLDDTGGNCTAEINIDQYYTDPGASGSNACKDRLAQLAAFPPEDPTFLPIYDGVQSTGNNGQYHLKGFAALVITGYSIPGASQASWLSGKVPCKGSDKCISGFFTQGLVPSGAVLGGPYLGAATVKLVS
jgi:hypothetical protein